MKAINILSLIEAYRSLSPESFGKLMNSYGVTIDKLKGIKDYELDGIEALIYNLNKCVDDAYIYDNYYLGYSIPQIGKEFDLLRFGENYNVNIEIKRESTIDKIQKQQERNKYYLSFLGNPHIYTYIQNENKLYKLVGDKATVVTFAELYGKLSNQITIDISHIDSLFNPSDYLVSPFNSTDKFMNGEYFLTIQQEHIYKQIHEQLLDSTTNFIALTGDAGTGKTLLTYHIAKQLIIDGKTVLILHCAQLNSGHHRLIDEWNWRIDMPKYAEDIGNYDVVIIDEAQRMYPTQFARITADVINADIKCIFSYDWKQYLSNYEQSYNIRDRIETELACKPHRLTDKIRTNKEISYFIKQLFNANKSISNITYPNIELIYCSNYESAKKMLENLSNNGWEVPNYTPGTRTIFQYERYGLENKGCAHSVIGQEFDNVVIVIDEYFRYDADGNLMANSQYYSQRQMLYQIITRTRKRLCVVVINNEKILNRCIEILS